MGRKNKNNKKKFAKNKFFQHFQQKIVHRGIDCVLLSKLCQKKKKIIMPEFNAFDMKLTYIWMWLSFNWKLIASSKRCSSNCMFVESFCTVFCTRRNGPRKVFTRAFRAEVSNNFDKERARSLICDTAQQQLPCNQVEREYWTDDSQSIWRNEMVTFGCF